MKIKKLLKLVWDEFIYGGHLLSLGAVSIVFTSAILLKIKITWDCLLVVYLGTGAVYLFYQFKDIKKDFLTNPERTKHIKKYVEYIPLIVFLFSFAAIIIVVYFNKISALIFGLLLLFLGLLYNVFLKKITKKIIAFKNLLASLIGVFLIVFLVFYYSFSFSLLFFLFIIFVYLRWFINTSFLDIKDIESDRKEGLLTLPIVFEKGKLFNVLSLITVVAVIPIIIGVFLKLLPMFSLMLLFTIPYTFYYLRKIKTGRANTPFLNYIFVDGEFILWSIFILLGRYLLW